MSTSTVETSVNENLQTKVCPQCSNDLPIDDFGIVRSRKDGRNLYCKPCVRVKVYKQREGIRNHEHELEMARQRKHEREAREGKPSLSQAPQMTLSQRVIEAIRSGALTQTEIALELAVTDKLIARALSRDPELRTRLLMDETGITLTEGERHWQRRLLSDELGDAIADLAGARAIRSEIVEGRRIYFLNPTAVNNHAPRQMSLFQLAHNLGPISSGSIGPFRRVEKRERPEGLEPPARSRVA